MTAAPSPPASPRLVRLVRGQPAERQPEPEERCDLCNAPIPGEHRHLLDVDERRLKCVCRPCGLLFDRPAAAQGQLRLVPDRRLRIEGFQLADEQWDALAIPVDMAFFFRSTPLDRVAAFYPSPAGATESLLDLGAWEEIEAANPVLEGMEADVEALLVNRAGSVPGHWLVPVDDCYRLVALMRSEWRGLNGGRAVWQAIDGFFEELGRRARPARPDGEKLNRKSGQEGAPWRT